jgi:hypothetical protein
MPLQGTLPQPSPREGGGPVRVRRNGTTPPQAPFPNRRPREGGVQSGCDGMERCHCRAPCPNRRPREGGGPVRARRDGTMPPQAPFPNRRPAKAGVQSGCDGMERLHLKAPFPNRHPREGGGSVRVRARKHAASGRSNSTASGSQFLVQVSPFRIESLDQFELPFPSPLLDGLFSPDGRDHRRMGLIPDQLSDAVSLGEAVDDMVFVLLYAPQKLAGHSSVKGAIPAVRQNVDAGLLHCAEVCHESALSRGARSGLDPRLRGGDGWSDGAAASVLLIRHSRKGSRHATPLLGTLPQPSPREGGGPVRVRRNGKTLHQGTQPSPPRRRGSSPGAKEGTTPLQGTLPQPSPPRRRGSSPEATKRTMPLQGAPAKPSPPRRRGSSPGATEWNDATSGHPANRRPAKAGVQSGCDGIERRHFKAPCPNRRLREDGSPVRARRKQRRHFRAPCPNRRPREGGGPVRARRNGTTPLQGTLSQPSPPRRRGSSPGATGWNDATAGHPASTVTPAKAGVQSGCDGMERRHFRAPCQPSPREGGGPVRVRRNGTMPLQGTLPQPSPPRRRGSSPGATEWNDSTSSTLPQPSPPAKAGVQSPRMRRNRTTPLRGALPQPSPPRRRGSSPRPSTPKPRPAELETVPYPD